MPDISANEGLYRFSGNWGYVVMDGFVRAEITELQGTVEINKIEVPLVGSNKFGHKPGREQRDGTMRVQKIDTFWEKMLYDYSSQSVADRRAKRGTAAGAMRPFNVQLWLDDPDALGKEVWQLNGCLIWRLNLGFSITDDLMEREIPFTWESETPLVGFGVNHPVQKNPNTGLPNVTPFYQMDLTNPTP